MTSAYSLLRKCTSLRDLRAVHFLIIHSGLETNNFLASHLIRSFACFGSLEEANQVFERLQLPDVYTWSAVTSANAKLGQAETALELYPKMHLSGIGFDKHVFLAVLKACTVLSSVAYGVLMHNWIIESQLLVDVLIGSALVNMYAKCGCLLLAIDAFENLPEQNLVSWSALIAGCAQHGAGPLSLEYFKQTQQIDMKPDKAMFLSVLKACGISKNMEEGKLLHCEIIKRQFTFDVFIGSTLVDMYSKCGGLQEAEIVFRTLPIRNIVSWNAIISGYVQHGFDYLALQQLDSMRLEGLTPNKVTFMSALKACGSLGAIEQGKLLHSQIVKQGLTNDVVLASILVAMYAKWERMEEASKLFESLQDQNADAWGVMIAAYAKYKGSAVIDLYERMVQKNIKADRSILSSLLVACANSRVIEQGRLLHEQLINSTLLDLVITNNLVHMYANCGSLEEARKVFDECLIKDVMLWGAMITGYAQHGEGSLALFFFNEMRGNSIKPSEEIFSSSLKACGIIGALEQGRLIHAEIIDCGQELTIILGNSILDMYVKSRCLVEARKMFQKFSHGDVLLWGAMLSGYVQSGEDQHALEMYERMQHDGINPNGFILSTILKVCSLEQGRAIHEYIIEAGLMSDVTSSSLVEMYAKGCSMEEAHFVFSSVGYRCLLLWNALIAGYVQHGICCCAWELSENMGKDGITANNATFFNLLKGCCSNESIEEGRIIHTQIIASGLLSDVIVQTALIDMYVKLMSMEEASKVFDIVPNENIMLWGVIMAGYAHHGQNLYAFHVYEDMQHEGVKPDEIILSIVLKACGNIGAIQQVRVIHEQLIKSAYVYDDSMGNSLVNAYAKCGNMEEANRMFEELPNQNMVSWGSMIAGYARNGSADLASQCFKGMQREGLKPDALAFSSMLYACTHAGFIEEGRWYFNSMSADYGILPDISHFTCMADLLGHAGYLNEAIDLLQTTCAHNIVGWTTLLCACRKYNDMKLGQHCFVELTRLDPTSSGGYVLMSSIYATGVTVANEGAGSNSVAVDEEWESFARIYKDTGQCVKSSNMMKEYYHSKDYVMMSVRNIIKDTSNHLNDASTKYNRTQSKYSII